MTTPENFTAFHPNGKIKLKGFNNLTKCLSFNLYDFCIADTEAEEQAFFKMIEAEFCAERVTKVLTGICEIIEANVISVSKQDYDPWGASSLVLMSDIKGSGITAHLDKSHICAHTYPDVDRASKICTFRLDIDIATCGEISPLNALNFMLNSSYSDVVVVDYVVRGFTRDAEGRRIYLDHPISSVQDYISADIKKDYHCVDLCLQSENIWQTKMLRTRLDENSYFLNPVNLQDPKIRAHLAAVKREMRAVLHMYPE
jgi:S-adenosylmethionine decarboxylase